MLTIIQKCQTPYHGRLLVSYKSTPFASYFEPDTNSHKPKQSLLVTFSNDKDNDYDNKCENYFNCRTTQYVSLKRAYTLEMSCDEISGP